MAAVPVKLSMAANSYRKKLFPESGLGHELAPVTSLRRLNVAGTCEVDRWCHARQLKGSVDDALEKRWKVHLLFPERALPSRHAR